MQQGMQTRINVITLVLGLALLTLVGRLVFIQSVCHADYAARARNITTHCRQRPGGRGTLVDRRGKVLAHDRPVYDLHCYLQGLQRSASRHGGDLLRDLEALLGPQEPQARRRLQAIVKAGEVRTLKRFLLEGRRPTGRQLAALADYLLPVEGRPLRIDPGQVAGSLRYRLLLYGRLGVSPRERQVLTGDTTCCPALVASLPRRLLERHGAELRAGSLGGWSTRRDLLRHLVRPRDRVLAKGITDAGVLRQLRCGDFPRRWARALGLYLERRYVREYRLGSDGGSVLGLLTPDGATIGLEGHPNLRPGRPGWAVVDSHGRPGDLEGRLAPVTHRGDIYRPGEIPPTPSWTLRLTLDARLQVELARILRREAARHEPDHCAALVMDVNTGDLLAMHSWPLMDPTGTEVQEGRTRVASRRNHCIESRFPPGSTMKSLVIAAAHHDGLVTLATPVDCSWNHPQGYRIPRCRRPVIRDDHRMRDVVDPARTPVAQVLVQSSNIGAYRIGQCFTRQRFVEWFRTYGLHRTSGLPLPREVDPACTQVLDLVGTRPNREGDFARWVGPSASFGYGFAVNLVSLASSYCALVNGGYLVRPRLIQARLDGTGKEHPCPPRLRPRILSAGTAEAMRATLARVVADPNGTAYRMAGDRRGLFGGKTGTAFRRIGGRRVYWATFVGFAPVDKPRYLAAAVFYKENTSRFYGGERAGPTVRDLLAWAVEEDR